MSGLTTVPLLEDKPPWNSIQWLASPKKFKHCEFEIIKGSWEEDPNDYIESLKESIKPYDSSELWDLAKRITNPYELVSTFSNRLQLPKSTCCLHPLSRSFFKMVEILKHLNFFERHSRIVKLRSLHICEGPGGFIEAFLNRAEHARVQVSVSYGMTLKSTNSIIPGWRRAQQFLQRNSNVQLLYGSTGNGDIYESANQEYVKNIIKKGGVHFITADGGFDFSDDFHSQEKLILRLLVNSAIIILQNLVEGGDCVLKLFDIQSQVTRDFIAILASNFKSWTLYKPTTSRPCNSEWYFIAKDAIMDKSVSIGILQNIRDILASGEHIKKILKDNPINEILKDLQQTRLKKQEQSLENVLDFCNKQSKNEIKNLEEMWQIQRPGTIKWCNYFGMPTIDIYRNSQT